LRFNSNIKEAAEFQKAKLAYRAFFKLHPGKYRIKLAVSDEANDLGIAEESLEIPALKEKEVGASSLILAERASKVSETTQQLKAQLLGENNPLLFGETQVEPSVGYKVTINGAVPILFRLYNVPGAPEQWDLKAKATLINEKEARIPLDQFSLKNLISPAENGQGVALANIPMKNAPVGKYKLKIDIFNSASTQLASLQTDLEVIQ
jgi:hypothetical protein